MLYKQIYLLCMCIIIVTSNTTHGEFLQSVSSFFGGKPYEATIEKDYTLDAHGRLTLKNIHGNIIIKTGLDKKSVAIRAVKHASAQEHLDHMHIIEEEVKPEQLTLRTAYDYEKVKGSINYVITIPDDASVHISCDTGDIFIAQVRGAIGATTGNGNIVLDQPSNKAQATVTQQGNITVWQPSGTLEARTNKGTLLIRDSMHAVSAHAKQGKIDLKCKKLPAQQQIRCTIASGPLFLHLPKDMHCSLMADAPNGTIISEVPICLKTETTLLDTDYWNRVKKQVRGSIGKHEAAVKLHAKQGNIKILGS